MFVQIHKHHQYKDTAQIISNTTNNDYPTLANEIRPAKQVPTKSIISVWTLSASTVVLLRIPRTQFYIERCRS
jgi:hypothetical protein